MRWRRFFEMGGAVRVSAALAGMGVVLGALGAHALKPELLERGQVEVWGTAVLYHLVHAVVMLVLAFQCGAANRMGWLLMGLGTVGFSGSLYLLSTAGWRFLGPVTPLGGLLLVAGWVTLMVKPGRISS